MTKWISPTEWLARAGRPWNLSGRHRRLVDLPVPQVRTPAEYQQCQQCGHRNEFVKPYEIGTGQGFCQPSCTAVRHLLNQRKEQSA